MKGKKFGDHVQCSTSIKRLLRFYIIVATWDFPWISAMSNKGKMQSCAVKFLLKKRYRSKDLTNWRSKDIPYFQKYN